MSTRGDAPVICYEPPAIEERTAIAALATPPSSDVKRN